MTLREWLLSHGWTEQPTNLGSCMTSNGNDWPHVLNQLCCCELSPEMKQWLSGGVWPEETLALRVDQEGGLL